MIGESTTVLPYSQYGYVNQLGKPIGTDVEQWFQQGVRGNLEPKGRIHSSKRCLYTLASIVCGIIILTAILVPALWSVFHMAASTSGPATATTTPTPSTEYLWSFDSSFQDWTSTYNGTGVNGASLSPTTVITGYGQSLSLSAASSQSVLISSPFINFSAQSWTVEVWVYLLTVSASGDNAILGQCQATKTDQCLHLVIRTGRIYMGFYGDDIAGVTTLVPSTWYHLAYVFNVTGPTQAVYLNGVIESKRLSNVYLGNNGSLTIGTTNVLVGNNQFNGFIDQLDYINRAKATSEILDDATLTFDFSFDGGSIYDGGSLRINGSLVGSTSVVTGRVNQALQLGSSANSYFTVSGLVLLGTSNQSYSMSIWIQPSSWSGTIIHVSSLSTGTGWCVGMLGLSSSGQLITTSWQGSEISVTGPVLPLNTWTHAATTYSTTNGLRLYVNGTLWNPTAAFGYIASSVPDYLFLGNPVSGVNCARGSIVSGQYSGAVDEFRLYSRELTANNVLALANP